MEKKKERKNWYDVVGDVIEVYIPCAVFIFLKISGTKLRQKIFL